MKSGDPGVRLHPQYLTRVFAVHTHKKKAPYSVRQRLKALILMNGHTCTFV